MNNKIWIYTIYFLVILNILFGFSLLGFLDSRLEIVACDVGQGDAILIQKGKTQIIIDGGPGSKVSECLSRYIPFWDRQIELVVLTHPDLDHYEGLITVFRNYKVMNYLTSSLTSDAESFKALQSEIEKNQPNFIKAHAGISITNNSINLQVLNPLTYEADSDPKENNESVVVYLNYLGFDALFTGDIEQSASDYLSTFPQVSNLEYLKVPHHGSKNGLSQTLLDITNPKLSIISVGKKNRYNHPSSEVLVILSKTSTQVLRTDEIGDVVVKTDGKKYNVIK